MGLDQYVCKAPYNAVLKKFEDYEELYYFRKFNALHRWVCANCMSDASDDNCTFIPIPIGKWRELHKIADTILDAYDKDPEKAADGKPGPYTTSLASDLFPTGEGFFFGSLDYDQDYFDDLRSMRNVIWREILRSNKDKDDDWNGDPYDLVASEEAQAKVIANHKRITDMEAALEKAWKEISANLLKKAGVSKTSELPSQADFSLFQWERDMQIVKWKEENGYDTLGDIYKDTGATVDDCCTIVKFGYYAWY